MFEVVEHEQQVLAREGAGEHLGSGRFAAIDDPERLYECRRHERGVGHRGKGQEVRGLQRERQVERETGLAHPARAGQRDQTGAVVAQERGPCAISLLAADEAATDAAAGSDGRPVHRTQRREACRQAGGTHQWNSVLWLGEVLQSACLAQVAQRDAGRQSRAGQIARGPRQEDLAAVPGAR